MKEILFCSPLGSVGGICRWTDNILAYAKEVHDKDVHLSWYYSAVHPMTLGSRSTLRRIFNGVRNYLPFIFGLRRVLKAKRFDVAHFSTSGGFAFARDYLSLRLCRKAGIRTALHFHFGRMSEVLKSSSMERRMFDLCVPLIDDFIAMDRTTFDALSDYGYGTVHYLPNPLSPSVEQMIESSGVQEREPGLVIYAGHVLVTKGVFELVEACRDIHGVRLVIMGQCTDEMRHELQARAGIDSQSWLEIPGNGSMEEVLAAMKRCSVFVLPSYSEGFPNVIIEAMACAAPIVATAVGAIPQMLSPFNGKDCGIVVAHKDSTVLKRAIERVLNNPEAAEIMGREACSKVHCEYSMHKVWADLKDIWMQ